jgi:DNA invertase Pin-like site-specific DNA recombinase
MLHRLPASPEDLRGLTAARWVRESTAGQYDNFGPDAQRELQDRMIERYGLVDAGLAWQSAASGRTVYLGAEFAAMVAAARAGAFDVLVVGYVSRFQRNLRQTLNVVEDLHAAGVVVLFCDERILSSDASRWDAFVREAHEAESFSRKHGKRVKEGLAAKRRRLGEPGGQPPYGYTRSGKPPVLEPIAADLERVRACFLAAAEGLTDAEVAARVGLPFYTTRGILTNPIYAGRLRDGTPTQVPAVVEPGLWDRVQLARSRFSRRHPGRSTKWRTYALSMLHCAACGRHLTGQQNRYRHNFPCPTWLAAATPPPRAFRHATDKRHRGVSYPADAFEGIVHQALGHVSANAALVADVIAALHEDTAGPDPVTLARIERDRDSAMARYRRDRDEVALGETMRRLDREETEAKATNVDIPTAEEAIEYLGDLARLWDEAEGSGRKQLAEALFERIDVLGVGGRTDRDQVGLAATYRVTERRWRRAPRPENRPEEGHSSRSSRACSSHSEGARMSQTRSARTRRKGHATKWDARRPSGESLGETVTAGPKVRIPRALDRRQFPRGPGDEPWLHSTRKIGRSSAPRSSRMSTRRAGNTSPSTTSRTCGMRSPASIRPSSRARRPRSAHGGRS